MNNVDRQKIRDLIREQVMLKGLSQAEIAESTGISQPQVSRILAGKFTRLSSRVIQICRFLDVRPNALSPPEHHSKRLSDAVLATWDGTKAHEDALVRLLSALKNAIKP